MSHRNIMIDVMVTETVLQRMGTTGGMRWAPSSLVPLWNLNSFYWYNLVTERNTDSSKPLPLFVILTWALVLFTICPVCSNLPCPWEQPEQVLMATHFRSKLTKVVLEIISSHLLGVLIPADIHRLPWEFLKKQKEKQKNKVRIPIMWNGVIMHKQK